MTDIALTRTARVEVVESLEQMTLAAGESITPGAPVRISGATFVNGNGTTATEANIYGIAVGDKTVPSGMAITAVARGVLDGFELAGDTGSTVYLSDTDATLADAKGTVERPVGQVIPGRAATLGNSDKLLRVNILPVVPAAAE